MEDRRESVVERAVDENVVGQCPLSSGQLLLVTVTNVPGSQLRRPDRDRPALGGRLQHQPTRRRAAAEHGGRVSGGTRGGLCGMCRHGLNVRWDGADRK
jgi:hypothetical protein